MCSVKPTRRLPPEAAERRLLLEAKRAATHSASSTLALDLERIALGPASRGGLELDDISTSLTPAQDGRVLVPMTIRARKQAVGSQAVPRTIYQTNRTRWLSVRAWENVRCGLFRNPECVIPSRASKCVAGAAPPKCDR